jgi:hypothetical protein
VDEWRRLLGQYARDLRDVTIVTRNIRSHSNPPLQSDAKPIRASRNTGKVSPNRGDGFEQNSYRTSFCTCFLSRHVEEWGIEDKPSKDGRQLLRSWKIA